MRLHTEPALAGTPPVPPPAPWQQGWLAAFPCDMPSSVPYPRVPLSALLPHAARRFPNRAACTLYNRVTTFAQLDEQSRRMARALADMGAGPGRHVGVLLPNIPEYLVALQAIWLTGATALQLSPLMVAEEVGHWLEATGCHIVVTLDLLAPAVTGALERGPLEHVVLTTLARRIAVWRGMLYRIERLRRSGYLRMPNDARRHRFEDLLRAEPQAKPVLVDPHEAVAVLAPTGGTTASPKAVMLTHRNLVANAMQLRHCCGGEDGAEGILGVLPFFHSYGLTVTLLTSWVKGSTAHLYPRFETRAVLNLLQTQRPELVPAVPAMLHALNNLMRGRKHDLSFIRAVISGASALEPAVRQEFEGHGPQQVLEGYGLTEASPVTHCNPRGPGNKPGTVGVPLPDTESRLVDPDTGADVSGDAVGELVVRGPQVMKGYFNNPLATDSVLRDGWLFTGDMARRDGDGYYTLVDRKRDIIKTSGFLVFPAEVEEVIRAYPDVAEAAVVGVPDHERGELVKALIVPRGGSKLDLAALEGHCRLHLGKQKRPRQIEVVSELPKNFLGKVLRRKLREAPAVNGDGHTI
ncbi:MAG TPA: AMP-binding protein [Gemmataceae bacterium]|nr:AMP-binding protein [Gemmataceae bacterium]